MQSVSSRIWTHVAVSISYDDNHYTTGISNEITIVSFAVWLCFKSSGMKRMQNVVQLEYLDGEAFDTGR